MVRESGGTADAPVLGTGAHGRAGSTPASRTTTIPYASWLALVVAPAVPELLLHQADDMHGLWQATGAQAPPYWAFAWLGGQALARFVLDNPDVVRGRKVLDLATGSGIVALAAARAGAARVIAVDIDPVAAQAVAANAEANELSVETQTADLLGGPPPDADVVLAADVLYARDMAPRVLRWLRSGSAETYVSDPGRDYLPQSGMTDLAAYELCANLELEGVARKRVRVFRP